MCIYYAHLLLNLLDVACAYMISGVISIELPITGIIPGRD